MHLFVHCVVLSHGVRIYSDTKSEEVQLRALITGEYSYESVLTPVLAPGVLDEPELVTIGLLVPPNDLNDVVAIESEGVL